MKCALPLEDGCLCPKCGEPSFWPQEGPQELFLGTQADIAIYGGAARGGKTFAILLECGRTAHNPKSKAVIFRDERKKILDPGGLLEESRNIYLHYKDAYGREPVFNAQSLKWTFHTGAYVQFSYVKDNKTENWRGLWSPLFCFDELTDFTEETFFFLNGRNYAGDTGIPPRIRASCNPDPDSWVKKFIAPWIYPEHPQHAESGEIRYFVRRNTGVFDFDVTPDNPAAQSLTFVRASIYDNKIFMAQNPQAVTRMLNDSPARRARMLYGDWHFRESGKLFNPKWFPRKDLLPTTTRLIPKASYADLAAIKASPPKGATLQATEDGLQVTEPLKLQTLRYWDIAATESTAGNDPDYTVGLKLGKYTNPTSGEKQFFVLDVVRFRGGPEVVKERILATAHADGLSTQIVLEDQPAAAGKIVKRYLAGVLAGFNYKFVGAGGRNKIERCNPLISYAREVNITVIAGEDSYYIDLVNELSAFPSPHVHDDQVDALSGAFSELSGKREIKIRFLSGEEVND